MRILAVLAGLVAVFSCPMPGVAVAGCTEEVVARIAFGPGEYCWAYRGAATVFTGELGRGQHITVKMRGEAADYDQRSGREITSIEPRVPEVYGPGNFETSGDQGSLAFDTPRAGLYRFSFTPCAMWGGDGTVEICAR